MVHMLQGLERGPATTREMYQDKTLQRNSATVANAQESEKHLVAK